MNFRALLLLTLFLLTQLGQASAWISDPATARESPACLTQAAPPADDCQLPCCSRRVQESCCCLTEKPQNPAPPLPVPPPPGGRELVPQPIWTCLLVHFFFSPATEIPAATGAVPALSVPACSTRCVSLPVLHCAFLI